LCTRYAHAALCAPVDTAKHSLAELSNWIALPGRGQRSGHHTGNYTCSDGKWKGQVTTREHVPELITKLFARKVVTMGFTGTYTEDGAEFEATALVGKRSALVFRLLVVDGTARMPLFPWGPHSD
jgi:hypothetical protein